MFSPHFHFFFLLPVFLYFLTFPLIPAPAPTSLSGEYKHTDVDPEPGWMYGVIPPQQPQWTIFSNTPRPPGTFLLNMLIKNEAVHLNRTLPKWSKVIDYWIIGVDDANTDESPEVIKKHLGHIPGHIEIVHFDGMGPTWTILVEKGLEKFPQATHGIIADADFAPMVTHLDRYELDLRCSKHMYTIWTEDHRNERKMDWIYRNIKGAKVTRRTHQIVEVPKLPHQEVFQTLINLPIDEREGGYQDRSGAKNERYIGFLEADLRDFPDDTRTLYYLGYAHHDIFVKNKDNASPADWANLATGVEYFKRRGAIKEGNNEERWFALLKIAEIYERYYRDWDKAKYFYDNCTALDPERADAWFYLGQHYRLWGDPETAVPYLKTAASLVIPTRSLFQWHYLYTCLSKLEYGRAVMALKNPTIKQLKQCRKWMAKGDCTEGDPGNLNEWTNLIEQLTKKISVMKKKEEKKKAKELEEKEENHGNEAEEEEAAPAKEEEAEVEVKPKKSKKTKKSKKEKAAAEVDSSDSSRSSVHLDKALIDDRAGRLDKYLQWFLKNVDELDKLFSESTDGIEFYSDLMQATDGLTKYFDALQSDIDNSNADSDNLQCRKWRSSLKAYFNLLKENNSFIQDTVSKKKLLNQWNTHNEGLKGICR